MKAEIYLGYQFSEKGTSASILENLDKVTVGIDKKINKIMAMKLKIIQKK